MPMLRDAVITLLREAARVGVLDTDLPRRALRQMLTGQDERWWNIDVQRFRSKKQVLGYAGRYARRPPIAQHRFRVISRQEIRCMTTDTRTTRMVETTYTPGQPRSWPGHPRRSHPRPLPAQHPVLRPPRASRERPDTRCSLCPPGPAAAGETATTGGGPRRCRKASASIHSWMAMASGCAGVAGCHRPSLAARCP